MWQAFSQRGFQIGDFGRVAPGNVYQPWGGWDLTWYAGDDGRWTWRAGQRALVACSRIWRGARLDCEREPPPAPTVSECTDLCGPHGGRIPPDHDVYLAFAGAVSTETHPVPAYDMKCDSIPPPPSLPPTSPPSPPTCYAIGAAGCLLVDIVDEVQTGAELTADGDMHLHTSRTANVWNRRDSAIIAYTPMPPPPWVASAQIRLVLSTPWRGMPRHIGGFTAYNPDAVNSHPIFYFGPADWNSNRTEFTVTRSGANLISDRHTFTDLTLDPYIYRWYRLAMGTDGVIRGFTNADTSLGDAPPAFDNDGAPRSTSSRASQRARPDRRSRRATLLMRWQRLVHR